MIKTGIYAVVGLHSYVFKTYSGVSTLALFLIKSTKTESHLYQINQDDSLKKKGINKEKLKNV